MKKKKSKMVDPPRFPKIIPKYEEKAKQEFKQTLDSMIRELTVDMVKLAK